MSNRRRLFWPDAAGSLRCCLLTPRPLPDRDVVASRRTSPAARMPSLAGVVSTDGRNDADGLERCCRSRLSSPSRSCLCPLRQLNGSSISRAQGAPPTTRTPADPVHVSAFASSDGPPSTALLRWPLDRGSSCHLTSSSSSSLWSGTEDYQLKRPNCSSTFSMYLLCGFGNLNSRVTQFFFGFLWI